MRTYHLISYANKKSSRLAINKILLDNVDPKIYLNCQSKDEFYIISLSSITKEQFDSIKKLEDYIQIITD